MTTANPSLSTESWPIERLMAYAQNARTHSEEQVAQIAASITAFGFNNPVLVDPTGEIIAGHGRVLALRKLHYTHVDVIVLAHLNEQQKRAFRLADNRLALNAGWDAERLRLELEALQEQEFDLQLTGFDEQVLKELVAQAARQVLLDADQAPEPQPRAVTMPGEMIRLGDHRLVCGDGTRGQDLQQVLAGQLCDLVFTDLPYNVDYEGKSAAKMKLANDHLGSGFGDFLGAACRGMLSVSQGPLYICMSSGELHRLYEAFTESGGHWSTYIMWAKNTFTLGRSDYQRQYEPVLYGWREGAPHYWCGDRNQGDVWFIDKPHRNDLHPTMKPVALIERALANSSRAGDVVLDPFAGAGSTVIACENLGRQARVIELDPHYADVIMRRWEAYTGRQAVFEADGRSFDEVAAERLEVEVVPEQTHGQS
jgi:DNA modification methylase